MSAAYLFRIRFDADYLLILGDKIEQYQPVSGVYKTFDNFKDVRDALDIERDTALIGGSESENDIRINLPGKNLLKFVDWFDGKKGREISVWREFKEELIDSSYIPLDSVDRFNPEFIKSSERTVHYSEQSQTDELLMFDIFGLNLNDSAAENLKAAALEDEEKKLILVTADDIRKHCIRTDGKSWTIAENAR